MSIYPNFFYVAGYILFVVLVSIRQFSFDDNKMIFKGVCFIFCQGKGKLDSSLRLRMTMNGCKSHFLSLFAYSCTVSEIVSIYTISSSQTASRSERTAAATISRSTMKVSESAIRCTYLSMREILLM